MNEKQIIKRWNDVIISIGCDHLSIDTRLSELDSPLFELQETGVSIHWMINEAKYWLSCYYESGNCRCDDRFLSKYDYKNWLSETGKLKRLIAMLEKQDRDMVVYYFDK